MLATLRKARGQARAFAFACLALISCGSHAQAVLFDEVHTVAAADQAVPLEYNLDISIAGTYQITLSDLGAQLTPSAPLAAAKLAITAADTTVVATLSAPGSVQFTAAVGSYVIHAIGKQGASPQSGPLHIQVTDSGGNQIADITDTLAPPATAVPVNQAGLNRTFMVATTGSYQIVLADLGLPQPLDNLTLLLTVQGGGVVTTLPTSGTSAPVTLTAGVNYTLLTIAQANAAAGAGFYSASVTPAGGGTPVFSVVQPVGAVQAIASPVLNAGSYTVAVADLSYPAPLTQIGIVVTANGVVAAQLAAAGGSQTFTATANTYQIFALATPAGSPGTGSYSLTLQPAGGGAAVLSIARAVSTPGGTTSAYSFDAVLASAGSNSLNLTDFRIPSPFASLSAAAVQTGAVLGTPLAAPGSANVTVAAGPASFLVFAQSGASGSLLGLDLTAPGASPVFEATQGVGQLFATRKLSITTAGNYAITVSDVGFPAPLSRFSVVLTQGAKQIGSILGAGTIPFTATAGNYLISFVAQPGGTDEAGTYAVSVASAPVVTLQSDASTVVSGGTVHLTWSTQNATACAASGGWSGAQALSGTATSAAVSTATTFTLTCSGAGGTTVQAVTVNISAPTKGGSGGGALDACLLLVLCGTLLICLPPRMQARRTAPPIAASNG